MFEFSHSYNLKFSNDKLETMEKMDSGFRFNHRDKYLYDLILNLLKNNSLTHHEPNRRSENERNKKQKKAIL